MNNLKLDDISDMITSAILASPHLDKDSLNDIIKPNLKVWLKKADGYKSQKVSDNRLQFTIENKECQRMFWLNKFRDLIGKDNMQPYYDELDVIMRNEGFKQ